MLKNIEFDLRFTGQYSVDVDDLTDAQIQEMVVHSSQIASEDPLKFIEDNCDECDLEISLTLVDECADADDDEELL